MRQVGAGRVKMFPRREMLDLVVVDGVARGIVARNLVTGELERTRPTPCCCAPAATATSSTCRPTPILQRHRDLARLQARRRLRQPLLHADPPDLHPRRRRAPVQADADVRVPAQRRPRLGAQEEGRQAQPPDIPEDERDYYLERKYPAFGNLVPATSPRAPPSRCPTTAAASARPGLAVYLDFSDAIKRLGEQDQGEVRQPLRHVPPDHRRGPVQGADAHLPRVALHHGRPVGGLQPDDHHPGPVRAWARPTSPTTAPTAWAPRALMQGLADGYFVCPYTIGGYLAGAKLGKVTTDHEFVRRRGGPVGAAHQEAAGGQGQEAHRATPSTASLGKVMWENCRHGPATRRASKAGAERDPEDPRGVLEERLGHRAGRELQPDPGEGRPRGRLPRVRRAAGARRPRARGSPAAATSGRSTRRPTARPSATTRNSATSRPGSTRARPGPARHKEPLTFENVHIAQRNYA